jgi:hypothetical protein
VIDALLIAGGSLLIVLTLSDVFQTVVVPGGSKASLRVAPRLVFLLLLTTKAMPGSRKSVSPVFAPAGLVGSFVVWMVLLTAGFAMNAIAFRSSFQPPLKTFWDAIYLVGSSLVTIGMSETDAQGAARWVILLAGLCGLAVVTMAVTYLLMVQNSISHRDIGVLKLNTSAGNPPSAVALLERFAAVDLTRQLDALLSEARDWCVTVRQSHSSHPSLVYFRSVSTGAGWPAAVGALMDLALICELCLDHHDLRGPASLLREDARKMTGELAELIGLKPCPPEGTSGELERIAYRLERAGYCVKESLDFEELARIRRDEQARIAALAEHLGKPAAKLTP